MVFGLTVGVAVVANIIALLLQLFVLQAALRLTLRQKVKFSKVFVLWLVIAGINIAVFIVLGLITKALGTVTG